MSEQFKPKPASKREKKDNPHASDALHRIFSDVFEGKKQTDI